MRENSIGLSQFPKNMASLKFTIFEYITMIDTHSKVSNKSYEKCHDWESAIWLPSSEFLWNSL